MEDTVFSKIIAGTIPCHRVYEDEHVLAFLDVGPLSEGHTLVIPKEPATTLDELSDDSAAAVGRALPRVCRAVTRATGATSYNVLQNNGVDAGQNVMHVHFHVIPHYPERAEGRGLGIGWTPQPLDNEHAAPLAAKIAGAITD